MTIEIRTYRLHDGQTAAFHDVMTTEALPLLARFGIAVIGFGLSIDDDDQPQPDAYLIRSFPSAEDRVRAEEEFYGSSEWRDGPRAAVLSHIAGFHTVVFEASDSAVRALSASFA